MHPGGWADPPIGYYGIRLSGQYASYWNAFLLIDGISTACDCKQSLGQGNVFTRVCHSVHRREGVSDDTTCLAA